ncbi:MAG: HupE/UreJ family protein [Woeseiaceae bacterium]|nr:HupE/UreJ family protein [Woeseiaceae bacterium]
MIRCLRATLLTIGLLCHAATAGAHSRSESYSHWYVDDHSITGSITIPLREVMLLYQVTDGSMPPGDVFSQELSTKTRVRTSSTECPATSVNQVNAASGFVRVEMHFDCGDGQPESLSYRALFDVAPAHVHYAKLHRGESRFETLITDTSDTWNIVDLDAVDSYSFLSFLAIGIEHIGGGIDHIAFLIGMLIIAGSLGRSVIAVTGFTLGHSVSLGAAVLGYLHADGTLVEAFIGFTVALVAVEYFMLRRDSRPAETALAISALAVAWVTGLLAFGFGLLSARSALVYAGFGLFAYCYLLAAVKLERRDTAHASTLLFIATTCFGLVHGFGFAGFLMETGILGTSLFIPLLGFNLGVEIGQLALVVVALAAAALMRGNVPRAAMPALAAGLCGIGVYWFVGRTLVV